MAKITRLQEVKLEKGDIDALVADELKAKDKEIKSLTSKLANRDGKIRAHLNEVGVLRGEIRDAQKQSRALDDLRDVLREIIIKDLRPADGEYCAVCDRSDQYD